MATYVRTVTMNGTIGGKNFTGSVSRTGSSEETGENATPMAAGSAGTLSTRTDDDTGEVTLTAGHGQTSGTFNVFWAAGYRRNMTGTVTVNALALDGGAGDVLPIATTAVVVDKIETIDFDTAAAGIVLAMVSQNRRASVEFFTAADASIFAHDLGRTGNGEGWSWASDIETTPFTDDVSYVRTANGSSGGTNTVRVGVLRT